MRASARILGSALVLALLLPGVMVAVPGCVMSHCPMMAAAKHRCCPPAAARIAATCCRQSLEVAVNPPGLQEQIALATVSAVAVFQTLPAVPAFVALHRVDAAGPPHPLDSLAQNCVLRI